MVNWACSKHGGDEKYTQKFGRKTRRKKGLWKLGIDGTIMWELILNRAIGVQLALHFVKFELL
jgi:hypothetical protein